MSRKGQAKMDVRTAWNTWTASGSPEAAAEFFERVGSWTDGTAAQLTRGGSPSHRSLLTRDQIAERLRHHLGVVAAGEPVSYTEALDRARREVVEELRLAPPG